MLHNDLSWPIMDNIIVITDDWWWLIVSNGVSCDWWWLMVIDGDWWWLYNGDYIMVINDEWCSLLSLKKENNVEKGGTKWFKPPIQNPQTLQTLGWLTDKMFRNCGLTLKHVQTNGWVDLQTCSRIGWTVQNQSGYRIYTIEPWHLSK